MSMVGSCFFLFYLLSVHGGLDCVDVRPEALGLSETYAIRSIIIVYHVVEAKWEDGDGPPSMVSGVCSDYGSHGGGAALVIGVVATTIVMTAATGRVVVTAVGDNVRVVSVM
ncbi:hypothetical protein Ancab_008849 [Ancistrocladus abbreviatus]